MFHSFRDWKENKCLILSTAAGIDENFFQKRLLEREGEEERKGAEREEENYTVYNFLVFAHLNFDSDAS